MHKIKETKDFPGCAPDVNVDIRLPEMETKNLNNIESLKERRGHCLIFQYPTKPGKKETEPLHSDLAVFGGVNEVTKKAILLLPSYGEAWCMGYKELITYVFLFFVFETCFVNL